MVESERESRLTWNVTASNPVAAYRFSPAWSVNNDAGSSSGGAVDKATRSPAARVCVAGGENER